MTALTVTAAVGRTERKRLTFAVTSWTRAGLALSGLALWAGLFGVILSASAERSAQSRLYSRFRQELAEGTAPIGAAAVGAPVAVIDIARLHLHAVVVEGTAGRELRLGPGHRRDTVLPGQQGVSVLYGRAGTAGGPFGRLMELRKGDVVTATTGQGVARFVVQRLRRPGDPLPAPLGPGASRLVLATVEGTGWRAGWAANSPLYVDAVLSGKAWPAPARPTLGLPDNEQLGAVDLSRLPFVVLWLQLLVLAALGVVWVRARWAAAQAWLIGVPVVLALLWSTSNEAIALLPNVV